MQRRLIQTAAVLLASSALASAQVPAAGEDVIVWSATRKLDWKDFKAKAEGGALGGARIAISHDYSIGCRDGVLQARVQAVMVPSKSWVTYRILSSGLASRVGLRHEQVHFDQAEVYARRVRKLLRELSKPCSRSDDELNEMAERIFKEHWANQRRYDEQTDHGEVERRQSEWERTIAAQLEELKAFSDG